MDPEPAAGQPQQRRLATWGQRLGAYLIDTVAVGVVSGVLYFIWALAVFLPRAVERSRLNPGGAPDPGLFSGFFALAFLLFAVIPAAYFTWGNGRASGQTLGKRAVGIRVERDGGGSLGYTRALLRWFIGGVLFFLFYVPGIVDYLWPLWDPKRQALHDKVAGRVVVVASDPATTDRLPTVAS